MDIKKSTDSTTIPDHHVFHGFCANRPKYRDGKKPRATRVFTVNLESKFLIVQNMPDLNVFDELIELFQLFGPVIEKRILNDYPKSDKFSKAVFIEFKDVQHSRIAKRKMDNFSFMGNVLHVFYAPEFESVDDTREKLNLRRIEVSNRLKLFEKQQKADNRPVGKRLTPFKSKHFGRLKETLRTDITPSISSNINVQLTTSSKTKNNAAIEQGKWQTLNVKKSNETACSSTVTTEAASKFCLDSLVLNAEDERELFAKIPDVNATPGEQETLVIRRFERPKKRLKLVTRDTEKQNFRKK